VRRAVQPRLDELGRGVQRVLRPGDGLAERPCAAVAHVAGGEHALGQRRAAGGDVGEERARDHVVGVTLSGEGELRALADRGQTARAALGADDAQQRGAAVRWGEGRGDIVAVKAGSRGGGGGEQEERGRREPRADGLLATHGAPLIPAFNKTEY
jgi:hypothetical protein